MPFSLADAIFWVAVACCGVAQLAIVRSVLISPARIPDRQPISARTRAAEIAWAVLPGVSLALVLLWTWHSMHPAVGVAGAQSALR